MWSGDLCAVKELTFRKRPGCSSLTGELLHITTVLKRMTVCSLSIGSLHVLHQGGMAVNYWVEKTISGRQESEIHVTLVNLATL